MLVRSVLCLLCTLCVAGVALVAAADSPQPELSYVSTYNGPASAYRILRSGKPIAIAPLLILQGGDRVSVALPSDKLGHTMTVTLSINGTAHTVDASRPYCVAAPDGVCGPQAHNMGATAAVGTVIKNMFASVAPLFASAQEDYYSSNVDQMTSRGPPPAPSMPLLHTTPRAGASVSGGALTIPWLHGQAPFHVRIYSGSAKEPTVEQKDITTNEARVETPLAPGTYRVEVVDRSGSSATGTFDVVPDSAIPQLSAQERAQLENLPASLSVPISAGILAQKGMHHQWNLAAYQQLTRVPDSSPNVQPLRYFLVEATD